MEEVGSGVGSGAGVGSDSAGAARGSGAGVSGAGAGAPMFAGFGAANGLAKAGVSPGMGKSGMFAAASSGAIGSGAGAVTSIFGGSVNGPTGSSSSPESPSGIDEGAATGSEKTGSTLVLLVILSIAFCRSLSTVGFSVVWSIIATLLINIVLMVILA